jgi:hypothetical protein
MTIERSKEVEVPEDVSTKRDHYNLKELIAGFSKDKMFALMTRDTQEREIAKRSKQQPEQFSPLRKRTSAIESEDLRDINL